MSERPNFKTFEEGMPQRSKLECLSLPVTSTLVWYIWLDKEPNQ